MKLLAFSLEVNCKFLHGGKRWMGQEGVDQVQQEMVQMTASGFLLRWCFSAQSDPGCEYNEKWSQKMSTWGGYYWLVVCEVTNACINSIQHSAWFPSGFLRPSKHIQYFTYFIYDNYLGTSLQEHTNNFSPVASCDVTPTSLFQCNTIN